MAKSNAALLDISDIEAITANLRTMVAGDASNRYEICQMFFTVKEARLYEQLEYWSFAEWIENELSVSAPHASMQAKMFSLFKKFGVKRTEAINLLEEFGITHIYQAFARAKNKPTRARIKSMKQTGYDDGVTKNQINITITDPKAEKKILAALKRHGMVIDSDGRKNGAMAALLSLASSK